MITVHTRTLTDVDPLLPVTKIARRVPSAERSTSMHSSCSLKAGAGSRPNRVTPIGLGDLTSYLADGPVHGQRVLGHMGGEGAVGEVDAVVRALMDDDRQLGGRHIDAFDAADRTDLPGAGQEHGGPAAFVGEKVRGVDTAGGA